MSDKEINAPNGQAAGRDIKNDTTILQATVIHQGACPGIEACPHRPKGAHDAKEENEFFRDTGIIAGPRERHLLIELQTRHKLRWRGAGGMRHLWKRRCINYIESEDAIRITPSRTAWALGWAMGIFGGAMFILLAVLVFVSGKPTTTEFSVALTYFLVGTGVIVGATDVLLPEARARKMVRAELSMSD